MTSGVSFMLPLGCRNLDTALHLMCNYIILHYVGVIALLLPYGTTAELDRWWFSESDMDQLPYSAAGGSLTYNHAVGHCDDDTGRNLYIIEYCPRIHSAERHGHGGGVHLQGCGINYISAWCCFWFRSSIVTWSFWR